MSDTTTQNADGSTQEPTAVAPADSAATAPKTEAKKSLEDLLADLDDERRQVILGEVTKARTEAKNLRTRLTEAAPKVAEYDRLSEASKTADQRAQEALNAAQAKADAAMQRMARAEVKAALAGVVEDPESIIEDLNLARFVSDDGDVDNDAINALKSKYATFSGRRAPRPDPSQASGANGSHAATPATEFASLIRGLNQAH